MAVALHGSCVPRTLVLSTINGYCIRLRDALPTLVSLAYRCAISSSPKVPKLLRKSPNLQDGIYSAKTQRYLNKKVPKSV